MTYKKSLYGFLHRFIILTAATLTLAACGGGGGGGDNTPPPPAPVAVPDAVTTASGSAVTISVLANDTIPSGTINPASVVIASQSANGTAVANANGTVTFTPATGFAATTTATTTFTYTVASNTVPASTSNAATVAVTVASPQTWYFTDATKLIFFSNGAQLTASQVADFDTSTLYYNVHSLANPAGEIRGQIIPSTSFVTDNGTPPGTSNIFSALLTADQEFSPPSTSKATAYGTVVLDPVANTVSGVMVTNGLTGIAAHIHGPAAPGTNAVVLFPFTGGPTVYTLAPTAITAAQILDLKAGLYYLNVHTNELPNGELRGQLTQQLRFAALNGANQNPVVITTASGIGVLALDPNTRQVSGFIQTTGIVGTVAHVHEAVAGVNGGVIIPSNQSSLTETPPGSGRWVVPADPALSTLTPAQVISFNAGNLYFNVHSVANPGGEIRDQLVPATIKIGNATLSGASEAPPVTTAAAGTGIMALNSVTRLVNGNVKTTGIVATIAHVHDGPLGQTNPVIIPISLTPPVSTIVAPLAISTTTLPDGTVGSPYSQSLTATGGSGTYTWTVPPGTLPAGLNLSGAGSINGTPTAVGPANFTVSVTDTSTPAVTVTKALSVNVTAAATATVLFSTQVQPIFTLNCVNGCHSPGGISAFLNLTAGNSRAALLQAPAHVIAGSSATSLLYQKITGAALPQMPLGQPPLSAADQTLIKNWIDQGALNN